MNNSNKFQSIHRQIIESANGIVEDIFVLKTGVLMTKKSHITNEAKQLFDQLNIDTNRPAYEQHGELNSRITYLSFKNKKQDATKYNEKMVHDFGHRGVYNDEQVTFLIAGCAIETALEFIAHNEATVARLTSSKTNAQNAPLFKIFHAAQNPEFAALQKKLIKDYLTLKKQSEIEGIRSNPAKNEIWNILNLGSKVISFTISMSIKNWHKTLIGRLSKQGVETDMLEILEEICEQLKSAYPMFFNTISEYYAFGNDQKYGS